MRQLKITALLLLIFFNVALCKLAYSIEVSAPKTQIPISELLYLKDSTGKLQPSDLSKPAIANQFKKIQINSEQADFGFTKEVIWLKLTLQRQRNSPNLWILEIPYAGLSSAILYKPDGQSVELTYNQFAKEKRPIFQRFDATPLELSTNSEDFYLRVQSEYSISVPIILWDTSAYSEAKLKDNFVQALYYGGLLTIAIYNLLIFFSLKDRRFLLYFFFATFICFGIFTGNGYGLLFFWPNFPQWNSISPVVFLCLGAGFSLLFTQAYLKTKDFLPICNKILNIFTAIFGFIPLMLVGFYFAKLDNQPLMYLYLLTVMGTIPLIGYASIKKILMGDKSAKYLLIAFGFLWFGACIGTLRSINLIPSNAFTAYPVQIGSAFEMLLLAFALANQMRVDRDLRSLTENQHESYLRHSSLISHEFRTPLSIIETQATLLNSENSKGINNVVQRTHAIIASVRHLSTLFTRWTQADRVQNFANQYNPIAINLQSWLTDFVEWGREVYLSHPLDLDIAPGTKNIIADEELLQIALINLIDNAQKYSPENSAIGVGTIQIDNMTGIYVEDHGHGIPNEERSNIFDEYIRLKGKNNARGLGLGLSIVKKISELHGGRIEVISELGAGSSFILWFASISNN